MYCLTNGGTTRFPDFLSGKGFGAGVFEGKLGWGCAINKVQIKVEFSTKVDEATATAAANYKLNNVSLANTPATDATLELQEDGKTVIITAGSTGGFQKSTLLTNTGYVVEVNGVKNEAKTATLSGVKSAPFNYSDTVAPTVSTVTAKAVTSTKQVVVTFSEPIKAEGVYKINGKAATYTPHAGTAVSKTVTLTAADTLVGNTDYTLEVINEKDEAGNLVSTTKTFKVDVDAVGEGIDKVEVVGDDTVRVTFKEKMDASTLTATTNIKLLDKNLTDINSGGVTVAIAPKSGDTTGKVFDVTLAGAKSLFNTTTKKLDLTLVLTDAVKDFSGNKVTSANQAVSLTLDETAPTITAVKYIKPDATYTNGAVELTFSEDLASAPTIATTAYKAITDGGVDETATVGALNGSFKGTSKNIVILQPAGAAFAGVKSETLRFNAGLFTDDSLGANTTAATTFSVDIENGTAPADTQKPVLGSVTSGNSKPNTINVALGEAFSGLDAASVQNVSNYRIDGAPLPDGSYVTVTGPTATTAVVNLPEEAISESRDYSITVTGIKDKAGNVADTVVAKIALNDDKKPVLTAAAFNADSSEISRSN